MFSRRDMLGCSCIASLAFWYPLGPIMARFPRGSAPPVVSAPAGVIFDGDSITAGVGTNQGSEFPSAFATVTSIKYNDIGIPGQALATMDANVSANVVPLFSAGIFDTVHILGGTNDIGLNGFTDLQLRPIIQDYCAKVIAAGFKVYVSTITPREIGSSWSSTMEGFRQAYNAWLLAVGSTFCTGITNLGAVPQAQDPTNTTFFQDGLHPTALLATFYAQAVASGMGLSPSSYAWNPTPPAGSATFSFLNKQFLITNARTAILGTAPVTGKKVFTIRMDAGASFTMLGVSIAGATTSPGQDGSRSLAAYSNGGGVFMNGGNIGIGPQFQVDTEGQTVLCAVVDVPNSRIWFTGDGVTFFGSAGSLTLADVVAGTAAYDISAITSQGPIFPATGAFQSSGLIIRTEAYPATFPTGYSQY